MHAPRSYDYAILRLVPSVERGECINIGVILFCRASRFLGALIHFDRERLLALAPTIDLDAIEQHLNTLLLICQGDPQGGVLAQLSPPERFHWLVSPRSTIIQTSPVHSGLCTDPEATLHHLLEKMVLIAPPQNTDARLEV